MRLMKLIWPFRPKMPHVFLRIISQLVTVIYSNYRPPYCLVTSDEVSFAPIARAPQYRLRFFHCGSSYSLSGLHRGCMVLPFFKASFSFSRDAPQMTFFTTKCSFEGFSFPPIDLVKADLNNVIKQAALNPQPTLIS